jgi:hypothetical protein
MSNPSEFL